MNKHHTHYITVITGILIVLIERRTTLYFKCSLTLCWLTLQPQTSPVDTICSSMQAVLLQLNPTQPHTSVHGILLTRQLDLHVLAPTFTYLSAWNIVNKTTGLVLAPMFTYLSAWNIVNKTTGLVLAPTFTPTHP